jgi:hypothetical protein
MKRLGLSLVVVFSLLSTNTIGQERRICSGPQLGTWALQSFTTTVLATGEKTYQLGEHPSGFITYGPDCRMQAILVRGGRIAPAALVPTDPERVTLYDGFMAYAGTYVVAGDRVSHNIDASWNQAWTGTTQVRQFKVDGASLVITTLPAKSPFDGRDISSVLVWTKIQ